ncbi:hypothetical protein HTZ85_27460 [Escherichia coli]|nr:hypothetical protein [Escherichia coli]
MGASLLYGLDAPVPGAERKIFLPGFWVKNFVGCSFTPGQSVRQVVAVSAPRRQGPKQVNGTGHKQRAGTRRDDVKRGLRNGVVPYIPAAFLPGCRSAGHGATEAARPERSLQARGFHASDRSDSPKPRQRVSAETGEVRQQLPVGVGPDDRMPPAAGSRRCARRDRDNTAVVRIRAAGKRRAVAVAVAVAGTTTSSVTDK